jgi:hypothetical protein
VVRFHWNSKNEAPLHKSQSVLSSDIPLSEDDSLVSHVRLKWYREKSEKNKSTSWLQP